jgi:hypothetical protein
VDLNYLRPETYAAANGPLIERQATIPLARAWGGGHVASVDGMRFVVAVPSLHARPNRHYFGPKRGMTWLNMINDQAAGIGAKVVSGTPRDSPHLIDVLYAQDGGQRPDIIVTDTGSYSDLVFGLVHLLGTQYRPQLADLPDQKLWRIDAGADYGLEPGGPRQDRCLPDSAVVAGHPAGDRVDPHRHSARLRRDPDAAARRVPDPAGGGVRRVEHPLPGRRRGPAPCGGPRHQGRGDRGAGQEGDHADH